MERLAHCRVGGYNRLMAKLTLTIPDSLLDELKDSLLRAAISDPKDSHDRNRYISTLRKLDALLFMCPPIVYKCICPLQPPAKDRKFWECPECGSTHFTIENDGAVSWCKRP